jgi:hypothetical protein
MIYDLNNILDQDRFKRRCNALYKEGKVVELSEKKRRRTIPQNAYLHLILGWFAMETGNRLEFVKQEYFKRHINPDLFVIEIEDKHLGKVQVLRSSRDLDTSEMTTAIERFRNWASSEAGIHLPSPDEQAFLQAIEYEMMRQKEYL